jgi:photosystem II stability/assembly factor-like uncharacterized protein
LEDCKYGGLVASPQNFNYLVVAGQVALGADKCMGIVFSKDGGTTWTPVRINSLAGSSASVAAVAPSNAAILYVGGNSASYTALIYKSINGGVSWTAITNGIQMVPYSIAVDPQDPNLVYVGTYWEVWRSADGGTSWTKCVFPVYSYDFQAIVINKNNPNEVFAGSGKGVFYSQDRGLTWTDVTQGMIVPDVTQLYFDAATRTLYAGTDGGGICKRSF